MRQQRRMTYVLQCPKSRFRADREHPQDLPLLTSLSGIGDLQPKTPVD